MLSINEQTDLVVISSMTKKAFKTDSSFATGDNYKKSPQQTYLAACSAIIRGDLNRFETVMKTAADYHIVPEIKKFADSIRPKVEYAYDNQYLPLDTWENIQKSAEDFTENYKTLPIEQRFKVAEKIYSKMPNKDNASVELLSYANTDALCLNKQAAIDIVKRSQYIPEEKKQYFYALAKTATLCKNNKQFMKVAHALEKLDNAETALTFKDFFEKRAEEKKDVVIFLNGLPVKKADLTLDFMQSVLGKDLAKECFNKQGELNDRIVSTLPKSDKDLILEYYNARNSQE